MNGCFSGSTVLTLSKCATVCCLSEGTFLVKIFYAKWIFLRPYPGGCSLKVCYRRTSNIYVRIPILVLLPEYYCDSGISVRGSHFRGRRKWNAITTRSRYRSDGDICERGHLLQMWQHFSTHELNLDFTPLKVILQLRRFGAGFPTRSLRFNPNVWLHCGRSDTAAGFLPILLF
jgi:hypothetical protein